MERKNSVSTFIEEYRNRIQMGTLNSECMELVPQLDPIQRCSAPIRGESKGTSADGADQARPLSDQNTHATTI